MIVKKKSMEQASQARNYKRFLCFLIQNLVYRAIYRMSSSMGIPEPHSTKPKTHQQHIIDSQRELTQELYSVVNSYDTLKQFVSTTMFTLDAELETKNKRLREQEPIMRQFREQEQARILRIRGEEHARAANVALMEQQLEAQNKLVVTRYNTHRKSIDSIKMLGLFLKERKSNIGKIDFMGVNRTFITDPLHKMKKEGPAVLGT
jgi:hypothetical protein